MDARRPREAYPLVKADGQPVDRQREQLQVLRAPRPGDAPRLLDGRTAVAP